MNSPDNFEVIETLSDMDLTPIQKFYSGRNIFITGATGFMGKILLEKLLYSCPDIGNIYITARNKKGVTLESRVDDLLNNVIFERLKNLRPDFRSKIKVLAGEFSLPNLGMSDEDRQILIDNVNIVFHVAATVKFNEPLGNALLLNVQSTKTILEMAKKMKGLKALIHVSTAFCHPYRESFDENFYEVPYDPDALLQLAEGTRPEDFEKLTPELTKKWPNTYTYTKALAEEYIRKHGTGLPVGIFRPTIVISSVKEPLPCWCDNWYGITGYIAGCGVGVLRTILAKKDSFISMVPVDMSINGMISAAWDVSERFNHLQFLGYQESLTSSDIMIYNFSSHENRITWSTFCNLIFKYGLKTPFVNAIWYPINIFNENKIKHKIVKATVHWIPAYIVDGVRMAIGKSPQLSTAYHRFEKFESSICYFINRSWNFDDLNTNKLTAKMSDKDKEIFFCDLNKINWENFLTNYLLGVRRYLLKEDDSSIPYARTKMNRLYAANLALKSLLGVAIASCSYGVISTSLEFLYSLQEQYVLPIAN